MYCPKLLFPIRDCPDCVLSIQTYGPGFCRKHTCAASLSAHIVHPHKGKKNSTERFAPSSALRAGTKLGDSF
jgi:hypothetical protein